jgi:hypothetical protein
VGHLASFALMAGHMGRLRAFVSLPSLSAESLAVGRGLGPVIEQKFTTVYSINDTFHLDRLQQARRNTCCNMHAHERKPSDAQTSKLSRKHRHAHTDHQYARLDSTTAYKSAR